MPISLRKKWTKTPLAIAGLAVLVAAASAGVVIAQTRENRLATSRPVDNDGRRPGPPPGSMDGRVERAVVRSGDATQQPVVAGDPVGGGEVMAAGMNTNSWVGPVTPDERQRVPRKLSSEERNLLRQEIRSASEEVYQPYRNKKR
jgi:hypothetical protein